MPGRRRAAARPGEEGDGPGSPLPAAFPDVVLAVRIAGSQLVCVQRDATSATHAHEAGDHFFGEAAVARNDLLFVLAPRKGGVRCPLQVLRLVLCVPRQVLRDRGGAPRRGCRLEPAVLGAYGQAKGHVACVGRTVRYCSHRRASALRVGCRGGDEVALRRGRACRVGGDEEQCEGCEGPAKVWPVRARTRAPRVRVGVSGTCVTGRRGGTAWRRCPAGSGGGYDAWDAVAARAGPWSGERSAKEWPVGRAGIRRSSPGASRSPLTRPLPSRGGLPLPVPRRGQNAAARRCRGGLRGGGAWSCQTAQVRSLDLEARRARQHARGYCTASSITVSSSQCSPARVAKSSRLECVPASG